MKKGFTLIEILAVIVLLGIVAVITSTFITKLIEDSKQKAFSDSVYSAINAYANKEADGGYNGFNDIGEVSVIDLVLQGSSLKSGTVKRNDDNEIIAVNVTDGRYCANGQKKKLVVTDGTCN